MVTEIVGGGAARLEDDVAVKVTGPPPLGMMPGLPLVMVHVRPAEVTLVNVTVWVLVAVPAKLTVKFTTRPALPVPGFGLVPEAVVAAIVPDTLAAAGDAVAMITAGTVHAAPLTMVRREMPPAAFGERSSPLLAICAPLSVCKWEWIVRKN